MKRKSADATSSPAKRVKKQSFARVTRPDEKKDVTVATAGVIALATTATAGLINFTPQGNTTNSRSGRRITMTSIEVRMAASLAATTAGSSPIRVCIVLDKQVNGALPATTAVFTTDEISSPMNLDNSKRFKVLMDEIIPEGLSVAGPGALYFKRHIDLTRKGRIPGIDVEYKNATAGDITDMTTNAVYVYTWQNGNLITAAPLSKLYTRVRFIDP